MRFPEASPWRLAPVLSTLVVGFAFSSPPAAQEPSRITLEQTLAGLRLSPDVPRVEVEGALLKVTRRRGQPETVYVDPRTGEDVVVPQAEPKDDAAPGASIPDQLRRRGGRERIEIDGVAVEEFRAAPGGRFASYVVDGNLFVRGIERGGSGADSNGESDDGEAAPLHWQVTTDGGGHRRHGMLDWVYQEEVYGRGNFQGAFWSESGDTLAFLTIDSTAVKPFTVVDHVPTDALEDERSVTPEVTLYPKAGDPNPTASLSIADVGSRTVLPIDLASRYGDGFLIVRVTWNPFADEVWAQVTDRVQSWLELIAIDASTGEVRKVLREESATWVNVIGQPDLRDDGTFYWVSERNGTRDVFHYRQDGTLIDGTIVTPFDVTDWSDSTLEGFVVYEGKAGSPLDRHTFRRSPDGRVKILTRGRGVHRVEFHPELSVFVDTVSTVGSLPVVRICDLEGKVLRELASTPGEDWERLGLSAPELAIIEARDGHPLDVTVLKPDGDGPFPVFVDTYSGPNAPSISNSFRPSAWHQFLRQEGVLVLQCNVRTASGRGQATTGLCHRQLGVLELQDLEDAVAWACREHGGDPARVSISGWSYGGFMAGYALTHSDKFALGFAGAGVHDWQLYDTIYTERYMGTPQDNAEGYDKTSVIDAAANLKGHLVILHGTIDDNVHLQNSVRLIDALQRAGKDDFEVMLYPRSRHGVRSREQREHMRRLMWRVIERELMPSRR